MRDVRKYFKSIALSFTDGTTRALFELTPEAYLIISVSTTNTYILISFLCFIIVIILVRVALPTENINEMSFQNKGNVCLGILNGAEVGLQDLNIIGGISDFVNFFEHNKQILIPSSC